MDQELLLDELLDLAQRLEIEVRRVMLDGEGGGLCLLKGRRVLFVDSQAAIADQLDRTAASLAEISDWEQMYLKPQVRELLESYCKED